MNLECLNDIINNRLAIHIDISDENSWNLNTGFTAVSLNQWSGAKSDNINLYDYGLTQFDNGATENLYDSLILSPQDVKFTVKPVGYNTATGGTFYDLYPISAVTSGSTVGNYFDIDGGYLQGFFKLKDYNFEQLPARFNEGITIETLIRIDDDSEGIFYYMGARAEDKFNPFFSGETEQIVTETIQIVPRGIVGQVNEIVTTTTTFSGVTTSEDNYLNAFLDEEVRKSAIIQIENSFETRSTEQPADSINENVIAFSLQNDGRIAIKRVNENGIVITQISPNPIGTTGWTMIALTFQPDELIDDPELLDCLPARNGTLRIFVNGRQFWKLKDYKEFFFKGMKNTKEKQIGVPYNISFGGGSFGLKHSWHYEIENYILYDGNDTTYINNSFQYLEYPLKDDPCDDIIDLTDTNIGNIILSADTVTFSVPDDCDPDLLIPVTTFRVDYTGTTAQTTGNQYYIEYSGLTNIISNRDYNFKVDFYDAGIFASSNNVVKLVVYGTEDIEIVSEDIYDGKRPNQWNTISLKARVKDNTKLQKIRIGILIESDAVLNDDFVFFIDNWTYKASDILAQDSRKNNLTIEQNFDNSFVGAIQKLRVYDVAFTNEMILHNARIESNKQPYGFVVTGGGRLVYR